jgi:hypothetical protein
VQIGTRMPDRAEAGAGAASPGAAAGPLPGQGVDGTLLAVVPIPGTGTSLAIVGYPVPAGPGGADAAGSGAVSPLAAGAVAAGAVAVGQFVGTGGGLVLDYDQRRIWADGTEVSLTFQEFELLAFLAAHPATVYSRADLLREVWQRDFAADSRTVDVHVSRLRHKLGPSYGKCLVTEYRAGYQFRPLQLSPGGTNPRCAPGGPDRKNRDRIRPTWAHARSAVTPRPKLSNWARQPLTLGPAFMIVMRSRTRRSRSMAAR